MEPANGSRDSQEFNGEIMAKDDSKISSDEKPAANGLKANKTVVAGVAVGIGSAAIVAALLYATRNKRKK